MKCYFCDFEPITNLEDPGAGRKSYSYTCIRCGHVFLSRDTADNIEARKFDERQKNIISVQIRNEYEKRAQRNATKPLSMEDLNNIVNNYRQLDPLDKLDLVLLNMDRASEYVGMRLRINPGNDFPYYYCSNKMELVSILDLLFKEEFISAPEAGKSGHDLYLITKGYERLREIKRYRKDSRVCFVAMWFAEEMNDVYKKAIKPAIEYIEEGEAEPRFKAIRIDNIEHTNDINDEIIANIRRSRFMVCDLTGYRGGVYFEAGFAYGLGMEVIYTCREDWAKAKTEILYDHDHKEVKITKEGVHFDLEHRPQIRWTQEKLDEFKKELTNRIKAVII